jgi:ubiquinol-cytochrome c reductase core subunit 2
MKSVARPSFLSAIRSGTYATQAAAAKPKGERHHKVVATPQDVKVTRLPNGVVVASLENYSPLSRVAVLYNAGSRHESAENLGITHCIRAASNLSTQKTTGFLIAKQLQQIGSNLTCTTTRELVQYSIDCLRADLATGVPLLGQVATAAVFKPWEVDSLKRRLKLDLEVYHHTPEAQLIELLHRAAYRDTLGQSLYMHDDSVGSFSTKALEAYVGARHVSQGAAVSGIGVDHDQLVHLARKLTFHQGTAAAETKKAKYHGGEARKHIKGSLVHTALVTEGVAMSAPDFLTMGVLQLALGVGPFVKYGSNAASSKIGKAAHSAASSPLAASCINVNYSDSGLFGFQVVASPKDVRKVLTAVVGAMGQATKGSIADADLQRAKKQMKALVHMFGESSESMLECIGAQGLYAAGQTFTASAVDAAIDKITAEDVNKVAKKVINGKPTFAAVGDLTYAPYLDEIVTRAA